MITSMRPFTKRFYKLDVFVLSSCNGFTLSVFSPSKSYFYTHFSFYTSFFCSIYFKTKRNDRKYNHSLRRHNHGKFVDLSENNYENRTFWS